MRIANVGLAMRVLLYTCVCTLTWALGAAAFAQAERTSEQITAEENALALGLGDVLDRQCLADGNVQTISPGDEAPYLLLIASETAQADIDVISAALQVLAQDRQLCPAARAAIASALQSSQLAQAAVDAPTGGSGDAPTAPFAFGGEGPPGGGGGSGYIS